MLEYLDFEGKYKDYVEAHDFWELCYVEKGNIELFLGDSHVSLSAGNMFLIAPDKAHFYVSKNGNQSRAFVVCFESSSQALKSLAGFPVSYDGALERGMRCIIEECKGTFRMNEKGAIEVITSPYFGGQQAILLQLEYLLICLLRSLSAEKNAEVVFLDEEQFYADLAGVVIRYFENNLRKRLSLHDICDKFNYSRSFLCKTFKEQTGESLFSCFNRLKIEEAKKLLLDPDRTVVDVARELGFSEAKYFGALFKSRTGLSPTQFREQSQSYENTENRGK